MAKDNFDVTGRVVIVTGGAGLLGSRYSCSLAEAGAHVVIADSAEGAAGSTAASIRGRCLALEVDVSDPVSVRHMVDATLAEFGRIDGLVNNAALDPKVGSGPAAEPTVRFEDFPLIAWERQIAVDLTGAFLCAQAVGRVMLEQDTGSIVNVSSTYGLVGPDQRLYREEGSSEQVFIKPVSYSVTKAALLGLTRYLATYWAGTGIRVNSVSLGGVKAEQPDAFVDRYAQRTPLGRMAEPDEYSSGVRFLLSDASSYVTGANLVMDGGWTAW